MDKFCQVKKQICESNLISMKSFGVTYMYSVLVTYLESTEKIIDLWETNFYYSIQRSSRYPANFLTLSDVQYYSQGNSWFLSIPCQQNLDSVHKGIYLAAIPSPVRAPFWEVRSNLKTVLCDSLVLRFTHVDSKKVKTAFFLCTICYMQHK